MLKSCACSGLYLSPSLFLNVHKFSIPIRCVLQNMFWFLFQVVEHYLRQYKIPQSVKICSPTWNEFFAEFVERY